MVRTGAVIATRRSLGVQNGLVATHFIAIALDDLVPARCQLHAHKRVQL